MHVVNHFSQILLILNVQVDYYTLQVYSGTLITFVSLHDLNTPEKKHGVKHHFITPNHHLGVTSILRMSIYNDREIFVPPPRKFGDWAFLKINPEAKFPGRKVDRLKTYQVKDTPVYDMKSNVYVYTFGRTSFRETELCSKEEFDAWHTHTPSPPSKTPFTPKTRVTPKTRTIYTYYTIVNNVIYYIYTVCVTLISGLFAELRAPRPHRNLREFCLNRRGPKMPNPLSCDEGVHTSRARIFSF